MWPRSATPTPPEPETGAALESPPLLVLECRPGRLRRLRHRLLLIPVALAVWLWFGLTGTVVLVIWWWHQQIEEPRGCWRFDPARARAARLGPWRTWVRLDDGESLEIFNDELDGRDLAALRRCIKSQLSSSAS